MDIPVVTCTKEASKHSSKKHLGDYTSEFVRSSFHDSGDECDSSDSLETVSDEIPVWIHGEQRWISGVNEDTTCADIVSVLLADEGIPGGGSSNKGFVITERWRRVEQILHDDTKILQIWSAWGHAKSEVKLTLRQLEPTLSSWQNPSHDKDSGMGSPNGSSNSAIIRRRRHRASKTTTAWVTQAQTIHPKSQKATIEKLMKLILEQGETIQQQLAKLRDRELQIAKIEEERHKIREREHGKNYLLETYLNGLQEAEEKEVTTVNSDSGVQTEGALSSPEISSYNQEDEDYATEDIQGYDMYREKPSHREKKLLKEHKHTKEFSSLLNESSSEQFKELEDDVSAKIEWMEKLVLINKHLQREEELLVRLGAKIRKYESENPLLDENQIREALLKVNASIEVRGSEIKQIEDDLLVSNEQLQQKTNLLEVLSEELLEIEREEGKSVQAKNLDLNRETLAENLYSFSQYIAKPNYDFNEINENRDQKIYSRHTPDHLLSPPQIMQPPGGAVDVPNGPHGSHVAHVNLPPVYKSQPEFINQKISQVPALAGRSKNLICRTPLDLAASINLLHKPSQVPCGMNVYATTSGTAKLGPKKLISGICNEFESNSDTGLSSMGEDVTQLGTLV